TSAFRTARRRVLRRMRTDRIPPRSSVRWAAPPALRKSVPRKPAAQELRMVETPMRVLIVDDEAPSRRRLRDLLDDCAPSLPLTIIGEAANGVEALEMLQNIAADLVLTDIRMPDMDGIELARHLLKLVHPPVVIFTTAYQQHALEAFEVNAI